MAGLRRRAEILAYRLAWAGLRHVPPRAAHAAADGAGALLSRAARHGRQPAGAPLAGVAAMRAAYRRVRPELGPHQLDGLVRRGVQAYLRYWIDMFALPGRTPEDILGAVRAVGDEPVRERLAAGGSVVCFLGHMGDWDLAGAWATLALAPVTTVAERLEPAEVFEEFLAFRESLGMTVLPLDAGPRVLAALTRALRGGAFVPLLADRDLTGAGAETVLAGHRVRAATGPAALALTTGAALHPVSLHHESLPAGGRRLVITFHGVIAPGTGSRAQVIRDMTQQCLDALAPTLLRHTEEWHIMQPVFIDDLPARALPVA